MHQYGRRQDEAQSRIDHDAGCKEPEGFGIPPEKGGRWRVPILKKLWIYSGYQHADAGSLVAFGAIMCAHKGLVMNLLIIGATRRIGRHRGRRAREKSQCEDQERRPGEKVATSGDQAG